MAEKEVIFEYIDSPDYRVYRANGAAGGITPQGDIRIDLYFESARLPDRVIHMVTPDGLGPQIEREPEETVIERELQCGLVMTPEQARGLAQWIIVQVNAYDRRRRPLHQPTASGDRSAGELNQPAPDRSNPPENEAEG